MCVTPLNEESINLQEFVHQYRCLVMPKRLKENFLLNMAHLGSTLVKRDHAGTLSSLRTKHLSMQAHRASRPSFDLSFWCVSPLQVQDRPKVLDSSGKFLASPGVAFKEKEPWSSTTVHAVPKSEHNSITVQHDLSQ